MNRNEIYERIKKTWIMEELGDIGEIHLNPYDVALILAKIIENHYNNDLNRIDKIIKKTEVHMKDVGKMFEEILMRYYNDAIYNTLVKVLDNLKEGGEI